MTRLLIIADDFTGALDTGVQFSKRGISTQVCVYQDIDWKMLYNDIEVLVVDTESRHLNAGEAYQRVYQLCCQAKISGIRYFYKKTDSTLRGNIGAELSALVDACNLSELPFIPAYPKTGRITKNGYQYVDGVLLHETAFGRDPLDPVNDAYIPNIINEQTNKIVNSIILLNDIWNKLDGLPGDISVFDAICEEDMVQILHFLDKRKDVTAVAGCAGFAPYLVDLFSLEIAEYKILKTAYLPALVVCGSVNDISIAQTEYAEMAGVKSKLLSLTELLKKSNSDSQVHKSYIKSILDGLSRDGCFILKTASSKEDVISLLDQAKGYKNQDLYEGIAEGIGFLVKQIVKRYTIGTLVIFGGDTAIGIIHQLDCKGIFPKTELMPGIVLSQIDCSDFQGVLITKAGGFGEVEGLMDIISYIREGE